MHSVVTLRTGLGFDARPFSAWGGGGQEARRLSLDLVLQCRYQGIPPRCGPCCTSEAFSAATLSWKESKYPATAVQYTADGEISCLADQIKLAEEHFEHVFNPGKPIPTARKVARLRKNITSMKHDLADMIASSLVEPSNDGDNDKGMAEEDFQKHVLIVVDRSLQYHKVDENFEEALLKAENDFLRENLVKVLARKEMLRDLAHTNGIRKCNLEANPPAPRSLHVVH